MTDRIHALERLDELRRSGALSDDEFAIEKERVMAEAAPAADVAPAVALRSYNKRVLVVVALVALALALGAAYFLKNRPAEDTPSAGNATATATVPIAAPAPRPAVQGLRALPVAEQLDRAAIAAFGDAKGTTIEVASGTDYGDGGGIDERVAYQPKQVVWAPFGPVLLSEGQVPDAAHYAAGKVAAHYLRVDGDRFTLLQAYPKAVVSGSSGMLSGFAVRTDMGTDPVIFTEGGGTWQGCTMSTGTLTALRASGPVELASIALSYDNSGGAGEIMNIEGRIANVVPGRSFDVVYSGSRAFTETYVLTGDKFALQGGGESQMQGC